MESKEIYYDSILKINEIVNNFGLLKCGSEYYVLPWLNQSNFAKYNNLSITEILGPQFEKFASNWTYDSDGAYTSDNGEIYSSSDEIKDSGSCRSCSPYDTRNYQSALLDFTKRTLEKESKSSHAARPCYTDRVVTWSEILRRKYEDNGSTSSGSDSALDLRIKRKRTTTATTKAALPAWVFCTRYSDRPSAGPRAKRRRQTQIPRKPRTAFNGVQLRVLNIEFDKDPYLSEIRRHQLADELDLDADNVKVWFQNKRAKLKEDVLPPPTCDRASRTRAVQPQTDVTYGTKVYWVIKLTKQQTNKPQSDVKYRKQIHLAIKLTNQSAEGTEVFAIA